jgi:hypothetical protein
LSTRKALLSWDGTHGDLTGSGSESSSESDDKDSTLRCLRSELDNTLALVRRDVLEFRLEKLAALDPSHGGEIMLSLTFFQENDSLLDGLKCDSRLLGDFEFGVTWEC